MVPIKSVYFVSGSKGLESEKNTEVYMASFLSLKGHISVHFDNIHLKLSTHANPEVHFHFMLTKH